MRTLSFASVLVLFTACGESPGTDAGMTDAGPTDAGRNDAGGDAGTDAGSGSFCGSSRPTLTGIRGTEGLVIARDGTIYYSQTGSVGRMLPGGTPENAFVSVAATTVWGLALDAANETLYVGAPGTGVLRIDLGAATPSATTFVSGGQPNGLAIGPDGFLYYSDFSAGRVYRVDPSDGTARTEVTASTISGANGVAFEPSGTLLVASYATGTLFRLTLTGGVETDRATVTAELGAPDGVAVAADGRIFVGDQGDTGISSGVYEISGATVTPVRTDLSSPASVEFGTGALSCDDLYVAIGIGALERIEDVGPGASVPWH